MSPGLRGGRTISTINGYKAVYPVLIAFAVNAASYIAFFPAGTFIRIMLGLGISVDIKLNAY